MDMEAKTGNKQGRAVGGEDPAKASTARTAEALRKIKEKRTTARTKQSTISFAGATAKMTSTRRADKAAARHTAAGRTQIMINQKEEFIQCEAKATPVLAPKQAVRDGIGTLIEKLSGVTILSLEGDAGVVHNTGTLPMDWKNGLNKYMAIQGGNVATKHVRGGGESLELSLSRSRSAATKTCM